MSSQVTEKETKYIEWQNQATRFYISSRLLHVNSLNGAAAFCAQQCLESMLKATLIYWDTELNPRDLKKAGHNFEPMLIALEQKVVGAKKAIIPTYFYFESLYQTASRYPEKSIYTPSTFLSDLDKAFADLVLLVPSQFNSDLLHTFLPKTAYYENHLSILSKDNLEFERLKKHVLEAWGGDFYVREHNRRLARNASDHDATLTE